jgi:hypothetical protein
MNFIGNGSVGLPNRTWVDDILSVLGVCDSIIGCQEMLINIEIEFLRIEMKSTFMLFMVIL